MYWTSNITITLKHDVVEQTIKNFTEALQRGNFEEEYNYAPRVSAKVLYETVMERYKKGDFKDNTIKMDESMWDFYTPNDTIEIMKIVLTDMAKAMPDEPFDCEFENDGTYDESIVTAHYDGGTLEYSYRYAEHGWDDLECWECGYEGKIPEIHDNSLYTCPECGKKIFVSAGYDKQSLKIRIR